MIPYIITVALMLGGCLCFYKILLQKETFYRLNRAVLILCLVLSFSLPLLRVPQSFSFRQPTAVVESPVSTSNNLQDGSVITPSLNRLLETDSKAEETTKSETVPAFTLQQLPRLLFYIYWFGVIAFSINFLVQLVVLLYQAKRNPVIVDGQFRIIELSGDQSPSSFGNYIFINPAKYDWETYEQILEHEKIHAKERHTLDIIVAEIVLIFQWFNPFAWIYRNEVENNLEFLTDRRLLDSRPIDRSAYQMSLLKVSAPQLPLRLTSNYNQSLLKKRIVMMNAKRSNMHTAWKYFFLLPLLIVLVSLLNEPVAFAQQVKKPAPQVKNPDPQIKKPEIKNDRGMPTEGAWFATIKNEKVTFSFRSDDDENSFNNSSSFKLSELPALPRGTAGDFKIPREAGTMLFNGKFEGDQGMGKYKFEGNKNFASEMQSEGISDVKDKDLMTFFFIDLTKAYVQMLKKNGYKDLDKNDVIPMAALKIDEAYIRSWKDNGYKDITIQQLIPLHSLKIDKAYVQEIRNAGYKDISIEQLISLKAQGIDGRYINDVRKSGLKSDKEETSANDLVALKALDVNAEYVKSLKDAGYTNLSSENLVAMKAQNITPAYIRSFEAVGYKNIPANDLIAMKSLNITPEFVRGLHAMGYKDVEISDLAPLKSLNITEEYIKQFESVGYKNIPISELIPMKSQNITPEFIRGFHELGFTNIPANDLVAAKAMDVTPEFIRNMKEKGHDLKSIQKYIQLKAALQ